MLAYEEPNYWSDMYAIMTPPPDPTREQALERAQAVVADVLGGQADTVDVHVEQGPAGEALVRRAAGAELLVVGSRGRSALPGMVLGSVPLHCVVRAPSPGMVVRPAPDRGEFRPARAAEPAALG